MAVVQLNINQKMLVESEPGGHALIKGVAGSGKSTIAAFRLHHLSRFFCEEDERILFVAFNKSLSKYMENVYSDVCESKKTLFSLYADQYELVEIKTIDKIIHSLYYDLYGHKPVIAGKRERIELLTEAVGIVRSKFPETELIDVKNLEFLAEEISWVMSCGYTDVEVYSSVSRTGRTSGSSNTRLRKNSDVRRAIICLMENYYILMSRRGLTDFDGLASLILKQINNGRISSLPKYRHIIVDEVQDLSRVKIQIIKHLYEDSEGSSIMFLGDTAQSIYTNSWLNHSSSFKSAGFDMTGRSRTLNKNFRNTYETATAANSLISGDMEIIGNLDFVRTETLERHGKKPVLKYFADDDAELDYICEMIIKLSEEDKYKFSDIVVTARNKVLLRMTEGRLKKEGVPCRIIDGIFKSDDLRSDNVKLLTFHSVKGLEFPVVFVTGLINDVFPYIDPADEEGLETQLSRERRLLYVAMTRAEELLYLTSVEGRASRFLADIDPATVDNGAEKSKLHTPFDEFYQISSGKYRFRQKLTNVYTEEEIVRQWIVDVLIKKYDVPEDMLEIEYNVQKFSTSGRVDVAVFANTGSGRVPVLFCETKSASINKKAFNQLKQYINLYDTVRYAVLSNGRETYEYAVADGEFVRAPLPVYGEMSPKVVRCKSLVDNDEMLVEITSNNYTIKHADGTTELETESASIPIIGKVAAGPLQAAVMENSSFILPKSIVHSPEDGDVFALRVNGTSMIEAGINPGDIVIVRASSLAHERDIVIAVVDDEVTMKRYSRVENHGVLLIPENKEMTPIIVDSSRDFMINGVVEYVVRER